MKKFLPKDKTEKKNPKPQGRGERKMPRGGRRGEGRTAETEGVSYIGGRNSVAEALTAGLVRKLFVKEGKRDDRLAALIAEAEAGGVPVEERDEKFFARLLPGLVHQGVAAETKPYEYADLGAVLAVWEGRDPFFLLLDGIEDVRNLGAIIRTAECAGAAGILLPERRSCPVTYAAMKTAAGAAAYLPVCRIGNISQTLTALKEKGFWVAGTDMDGECLYDEANLKGPLVLVMGAEGKGMSRLTRELCDFCVRIPMRGRVSSLNVSVAAALLLYEAEKQRRMKN